MRSSVTDSRAQAGRFASRLLPNRFGRTAKLSIISLAMVLGLSSCSLDYVVGYVYMTTSKSSPGVIDQYAIDYQSGALSPVGTPVAAGNNPVTLVVSPSGKFVYVVNQGDSTVQEFAVQGDGSLVSKNIYKTTGSSPTAIAVDPQGAYLYVTNSCAVGDYVATPTGHTCSAGAGVVTIFPVNSDNSLGTATSVNVGNDPVGITVSFYNHFVYVLDQDPANPSILTFSQNTSSGALTPVTNLVTGKLITPAGVVPSAIAEEPTARFVYVTDQAANQLIGYTVQSNGSLVPMVNGPFPTGLFPVSLTIDPQGTLLYLVNYNSNTVQGFALDLATGTPSGVVGGQPVSTGVGPSCVAVDPALGIFLYTSNNLDNTVTGEKFEPSTGVLSKVQNSPFPANGTPTCLAIVPNGAHASQIIQP
jgi:6-phosphogluconolactonase (cycloisomerase 2 family)